jgi:D-amino-acid dehydrogenase
VVVVGAGAIGAAVAYALSERGARVAVVERSHVTRGCSYGNAGLICPSHAEALASPAAIREGLRWMTRRDSPFHLRPRPSLLPWLTRFGAAARPRRAAAATALLRALARESLKLHEAQARVLPTSFARRGILSVYESRRAFERASGERLSAAEARALEPALTPAIAGAVLHPDEAHCDPEAYVAALLSGADVRTGVELLGLRRSNGRVASLDTTAGPLTAGTVVLAAGAWTRDFIRLPLEGGKGYHVELSGQPLRGGMPIYMEDARVVATPLDGRLRLSGALDLSGFDTHVDPVRVGALDSAARRTLRLGAHARVTQVWRGLRPCAPDGLPIVGHALENLVLATGHAMLGITLAPVTAEIVADLVEGRPPRFGGAALSPARFRGAFA